MTDKERKQLWYLKNKELTKARATAWKRANRKSPRVPELLSNTEKSFKMQRENPRGFLLARIRSSAYKRGHEFSLTIDDLVIPEVCPYLGLLLKFNRGCKSDDSISVDRIDSSKGYVKGNIEIISDLANRMKSNASVSQQILFAKAVLKRHDVLDI